MSSEIRASATSDVMPTNECDHVISVDPIDGYQYLSGKPQSSEFIIFENEFNYCPICGAKL
jgi:hypothetical protein